MKQAVTREHVWFFHCPVIQVLGYIERDHVAPTSLLFRRFAPSIDRGVALTHLTRCTLRFDLSKRMNIDIFFSQAFHFSSLSLSSVLVFARSNLNIEWHYLTANDEAYAFTQSSLKPDNFSRCYFATPRKVTLQEAI